jgi:hypothetical protein
MASFTKQLAVGVDEADAELRADLIASWLLGIAVMRRIVGRPPLKDATAEQLARYFVPAIDHTDATDATAPRPNPSSEDPPKGSCGFTKT